MHMSTRFQISSTKRMGQRKRVTETREKKAFAKPVRNRKEMAGNCDSKDHTHTQITDTEVFVTSGSAASD